MTVSYIETMMTFDQRKAAYDADITYGTNSEFGFDYLRDNMAVGLDGVVQRGHPYGIVDEVDSILVDEARTPLIISGEPETAAQLYYDFARVAKQLIPFRSTPGDPKGAAEQAGADFEFDEKFKTVGVTPQGVAKVERALRIDNLYAVEIPTNVAVARADENDLVFKTKEGKFAAVVRDIEERAHMGQPVLVGTIAVETSEYLSQLLTRKGVKHNVLNAKEHAREAEIIKDAGLRGAVTIATNMAGRGVDIKLGDGVVDLGGLYVLGTERHESRRIDNQL